MHEVSRSDPVALVDLRRLRRPGQPSAVHIRSSGRVPAALVIFFIVLLLGWAFIWRRSTLISVDDEFLKVGSQTLPLRDVANATALDAESLRLVAGQDADPRAHLILRNLSAKTGVKIELTSGPTPTGWSRPIGRKSSPTF